MKKKNVSEPISLFFYCIPTFPHLCFEMAQVPKRRTPPLKSISDNSAIFIHSMEFYNLTM